MSISASDSCQEGVLQYSIVLSKFTQHKIMLVLLQLLSDRFDRHDRVPHVHRGLESMVGNQFLAEQLLVGHGTRVVCVEISDDVAPLERVSRLCEHDGVVQRVARERTSEVGVHDGKLTLPILDVIRHALVVLGGLLVDIGTLLYRFGECRRLLLEFLDQLRDVALGSGSFTRKVFGSGLACSFVLTSSVKMVSIVIRS